MNVVIDEGNSSIKIGFFQENHLELVEHVITIEEAKHVLSNYKYDFGILSSVKNIQVLKENFPSFLSLSLKVKLPFQITYATPETLGLDRIAAVAGMYACKKKDTASLVIDIGTCITYELLKEDNSYPGGIISPGINLRRKAMNNYTTNLPLVDRVQEIDLIGNSTTSAMQSGVMNGITAEITDMIRQFQKDYGVVEIFVCGGDAHIFETKIKEPIFVAQNLVLYGLNRILRDNVI